MNWYATAIEILYGEKVNYRQLIFEIAKTNPGAIVAAATRLGFDAEPSWKEKCRALLADNKR